nr:MAG TPA: hypothetical protein [Caudoviricetes sp.]
MRFDVHQCTCFSLNYFSDFVYTFGELYKY